MGTVQTPAEYTHICDGCGKETEKSFDQTIPDGWEVWSRLVIGSASAISLLLCETCGPVKASSVQVASFTQVPPPPDPPTS